MKSPVRLPFERHLSGLGACLTAVALVAGGAARAAPVYRGGAVASEVPEATEAALAMLDKGGNAVDAAVAAAFVIGVGAGYHSGIGGGGFALVFDAKSGRAEALDFREVAPAAATETMFQRDGEPVPELSRDGALSVAVPGAPAGYLTLLEKKGRLSPAVVLAPAIRLATEGFVVTPKYQKMAKVRLALLRQDPEAAKIFLRPNAEGVPDVPQLGTKMPQPELAATLRALAKQGAKAFYQGRIAKALVETVQKGGGIITLEDLASYKVRWREPLAGSYRGHKLLTMPPPSAGGIAVVQVLGVMEQAFPQPPEYRDPEALHVLVESLRRSYIDRVNFLGDPGFVEIPMARLTSQEYLATLLGGIDRARATASASLLPLPAKKAATAVPAKAESRNTSHLSVVDKDGNAVAMTTTVNYLFGSGLVARGTGVLLNDEMDDFAAKPLTPNVFGLVTGKANAVQPGKVPLSSMSPTLVFQKDDPTKVMLVVGSPGGSTIPTTVIQVILNVVDQGMDPARAVSAGRIHHQFMPDEVAVDRYGLESATFKALQAKGHKLRRAANWGDAHAVFVDPESGWRYAGSDLRNEGVASGQR